MRSWKPRQWPLSAHLAREYARVDARPLERMEQLPGIVALRLTGRPMGFLGCGELALIDCSIRSEAVARGGAFLVRLPAEAARAVGFEAAAHVLRSASREEDRLVLSHLTCGLGQPLECRLAIRPEWVLGKLVATVDPKAREWATWKRMQKRLAAGLVPQNGARVTIEADSFEELRTRLHAVTRVYDLIDHPSELLTRGRSWLPLTEALRAVRRHGLDVRELAAAGGDR